jgi:alpha-glucosidase
MDGDPADLDRALGLRRARAATLLMLALPGSAYLYQGEELGLPEVHDLPEAVLDDPVWERSGHTDKGRDGCRVPIPWKREGPSFGFGDNGSWLPQPESWAGYSVEAQTGVPGSTLELYREALRLRTGHLRDDEDLEWLELGDEAIAFRRGSGLTCVVNFGEDELALPVGAVLLSSESLEGGRLPGNAAVWLGPVSPDLEG